MQRLYGSEIEPSVDASLGSYSWLIPNTPSTDCLVRISDVSNGSIMVESENPFTIRPQGIVNETEPNDTAHLANTVAIGDTIDGTIGTEEDIDYL